MQSVQCLCPQIILVSSVVPDQPAHLCSLCPQIIIGGLCRPGSACPSVQSDQCLCPQVMLVSSVDLDQPAHLCSSISVHAVG